MVLLSGSQSRQTSAVHSKNSLSIAPSSHQPSLSRHHPHFKRLQAPSVPRLRMSLIGADDLPVLLGRSSVTSNSSAQISSRSNGSRDENDVPVYRYCQRADAHDGLDEVAGPDGTSKQRTPRGRGAEGVSWGMVGG